jgi:hypothetical protein
LSEILFALSFSHLAVMSTTDRPSTRAALWLAILAPVVFALHVVEEAPTFVAWFNRLVEPDITPANFVSVNGVASAVTAVVAAVLGLRRDAGAGGLALAWFGLLFFCNGLFHLLASAVHRLYSPGAWTSAVLYLPFFAVLFYVVVKRLRLPVRTALLVTLAGAVPMAVHGYLIIFRGSRLF